MNKPVEFRLRFAAPLPLETRTMDELIKRLRNGDYYNVDVQEAADALEAANARIAELSTCKLCNSTGHSTPCAYPTEINRQQAKRIAELEQKLDKTERDCADLARHGWELEAQIAVAEKQEPEPIYQLKLASGDWRDQDEIAYRNNVKHHPKDVRIVYAVLPSAVVLDDESAAAENK